MMFLVQVARFLVAGCFISLALGCFALRAYDRKEQEALERAEKEFEHY